MSELTRDHAAIPPTPRARVEAPGPGSQAYFDLLREEIQAAGESTRRVRWGINASAVAGTILAAPVVHDAVRALYPYLPYPLASPSPLGFSVYEQLMAAGTVGALVLARVAAAGLLAGYRHFRREQFARKLARFPETDQATVLRGLEHNPLAETRALVAPMLDALHRQGTEVTAVRAPHEAPTHAVVPSAERKDGL